MAEHIIEVEGVTFGYDPAEPVIREVSFTIDEPGFVCIIGPNGVGKSTLIKCINGIIKPTEGSVRVLGRDVGDYGLKELARVVGYVPVMTNDFNVMTVLDTVLLGRYSRQRWKTTAEDVDIAYKALEVMEIPHLAMRNFNELSAGQHQKVAIARALASGSRMLMLDEPLSALDARVRMELRYEIRRLVKKLGITVLHVTHDQEEAMSVSDRIVLMRYGTIAESGSPLDIYRKPSSVFAANFIGETNLMECTVSDRSKNGKTKVKLRGGREMRASKTDFNVGDPVVISVRPEHVYSANDGLEATVESIVFMGTYWRIRTLAESRDYVEYNVPADEEIPEVGDTVHLVFNKKAVTVFARPQGGIEEEIRLE